MGRLSRSQMQQRNRERVLAAAREEFLEQGFRDAKIDHIADRAELTRGAVYSNFPGKRALYFAVLADDAEHAPAQPVVEPGSNASEALAVLARAWVARLPLAGNEDSDGPTWLGTDLESEIIADTRLQRPFAQLMKLEALLVGLALEQLQPPATVTRQVRMAENVLTYLRGASQLAAAAPGFLDPFNVVSTCQQFAELDLNDTWPPQTITPQVRLVSEPWTPPTAIDAVTNEPAHLAEEGVVAVLGLHRLAAAEDALRTAPTDATVTAVLVTSDPAELAPLARLTVSDLCHCLHQAFPPRAWPKMQVLGDWSGAIAAAAGVSTIGDDTETAIHIESGRIVARAEGIGACLATPAQQHTHTAQPRFMGSQNTSAS